MKVEVGSPTSVIVCPVPKTIGFWSYVKADDEAEGGRISRLARDLVAQIQMLTGESMDLFLDRDAIEWGEIWRDRIATSLASVEQ